MGRPPGRATVPGHPVIPPRTGVVIAGWARKRPDVTRRAPKRRSAPRLGCALLLVALLLVTAAVLVPAHEHTTRVDPASWLPATAEALHVMYITWRGLPETRIGVLVGRPGPRYRFPH
jgi:hypothetical protein